MMMMKEEIKKKLLSFQDIKYQKFHKSLCPGVNNIIGIRLPKIRTFVKEILKDDYRQYLKEVDNEYYEETMIEGLIIATSKMAIDEKFFYLKKFVPKIDNWAICDTICSSFKWKESDLPIVWNFILSYQKSNNEFELRFMIVMMMDYFLISHYLDDVLAIIDSINIEYYYTNMAIAWLISVAFIKNRDRILNYLQHHHLSDFTYQKALQKIIESNRISKIDRELIRKMKKDRTCFL